MASISETGHARNVANLENLISFCKGYGESYNPSKDSIKINALNVLLENSRTALGNVTEKLTIYNSAINNRFTVFKNLKPLCTKLISALMATNASPKTIEDAKGINRKIQGTRANKKNSTEVKTENTAPSEEKTVSTSQQSYDQLAEHFAKLIALLQNEPNYTPNETDLKITTLNNLLSDIKNANSAVTKAMTDLSNSRIIRNEIFYKEDTGICSVAQDVKNYIKSIYGATSPQYKQVSKIKFSKPR
ncbi:MAG: hypothetical protein OHK0038_23630 [Flammeovirgaceae bacterium]